jgi:hypothetical protein
MVFILTRPDGFALELCPNPSGLKPGQEKRIFFLGAQPGDKHFLQTN